MARGPSGRIVIEVDPSLKHELHAALAQDGSTLKEWFLANALAYLRTHHQPELPLVAESRAKYERISARKTGGET